MDQYELPIDFVTEPAQQLAKAIARKYVDSTIEQQALAADIYRAILMVVRGQHDLEHSL
jgi:hypothetical protein